LISGGGFAASGDGGCVPQGAATPPNPPLPVRSGPGTRCCAVRWRDLLLLVASDPSHKRSEGLGQAPKFGLSC